MMEKKEKNNQIIRSTYRDNEQFEMEVLGETTDMGEEAYYVRILPKWQNQFEKGDRITKLRKSLIGNDDNHIYKWVKRKERYEQLTLFDIKQYEI